MHLNVPISFFLNRQPLEIPIESTFWESYSLYKLSNRLYLSLKYLVGTVIFYLITDGTRSRVSDDRVIRK